MSRDQRGAASLLVVALLSVLLLVGAALGVVAAMVWAHRVAQSAADLAALAGAADLQEGEDACAAASRIAGRQPRQPGLVPRPGGGGGGGGDGRGSPMAGPARGPVSPGPGGARLTQGGRRRAGPAAAGPSRASRSATAPTLSSGWFWLPHLGDWMHDGQPSVHSQARMVSRVALSHGPAASNPRRENPAPPGCPS